MAEGNATRKCCSTEYCDRINDLPDEIVCRILSFLRTKDSVKTCVLSKRWRFLWTSVPTLDVRGWEHDVDSIENFVDGFLLSHAVSDIKRFCIANTRPRSDLDKLLNSWISTPKMRNVEEMELQHQEWLTDVLPVLFTCSSLVVLKLQCYEFFGVPRNTCLPSLKVFHLSIERTGEESIENILNGSPVLEELSIIKHGAPDFGNPSLPICSPSLKFLTLKFPKVKRKVAWFPRVTIDAPSLKVLELDQFWCESWTMNVPSLVKASLHIPCDKPWELYYTLLLRNSSLPICFPSLKFLTLKFSKVKWKVPRFPKVTIDAPHLKVLELDQFWCKSWTMNVPSLVKANLCIPCDKPWEPYYTMLLRNLSHVKDLCVSHCTLKSLFNGFDQNNPILHDLNRLEITATASQCSAMPHISFSKLEVLVLNMVGRSGCHCDTRMKYCSDRWNPKWLSSIKAIEITGFKASEEEMQLVGYMLKNATALRQMKIHGPGVVMSGNSELREKLLMLLRGTSRSSQIVIPRDLSVELLLS